MASLYVHIPFCKHICSYCDFVKVYEDEKTQEAYVEELCKDLQSLPTYDTIYVGGGTPTALSLCQLERLLSQLQKHRKEKTEWTVESNVETLDKEKIALLAKYGVNRVSLGVQSFSSRILSIAQRHHTKEDILWAVQELRHVGIENISVDLIYGFPSESIEELKEDLREVLSLHVPHISTYSLTISPGTLLYGKKVKEASEDILREQYDLILKTLRDAGYERYEVSNFCKDHHESRHNLVYWNAEEYDSIGLGSSFYRQGRRGKITSNLTKFLQGERIYEEEVLTEEEKEEEFLLLGLRKKEGISLREYEKRFHLDFRSRYQEGIEELSPKLLVVNQDQAFVTDDGMMLLDAILIKLFTRGTKK